MTGLRLLGRPLGRPLPGAALSSKLLTGYGRLVRALRGMTNRTMEEEPRWHHNGPALTTGYDPRLTLPTTNGNNTRKKELTP